MSFIRIHKTMSSYRVNVMERFVLDLDAEELEELVREGAKALGIVIPTPEPATEHCVICCYDPCACER